jgi:two-component system response regulator ResD
MGALCENDVVEVKDVAAADEAARATSDVILVADDDEHIVELVALYLRRAGYQVEAAFDGEQTLRKVREAQPALVVLDIMMPGPDGLQICRKIGGRGGVPILLLTARAADIDKVAGLRLGADDYVTKPFNPEELVARVEAILRRARTGPRPPAERLHIGRLELDLEGHQAAIDSQAVSLTPREFDLLATLASFPNVVLGRDQLLDLAWGTAFFGYRTVDVHVARLREKIKGSGVRIETVWGTGYRLEEEA